MSELILIKNYKEPPVCYKEILRYADVKSPNNEILNVLNECLNEVKDKLAYKVCYIKTPLSVDGENCDFDVFKVNSENLAINLKDADEVIIFAATVGIEIDRLITKYSYISPVKAVMLQAIGTERVEALCNTFCKDMAENFCGVLSPRFSAGYGDLPLETQKEIFTILNCEKHIGLTLNESLIMSPTKSVTAFAGIKYK